MSATAESDDRCPECGAAWPFDLGPWTDFLVGTAIPCAPVDRVHQGALLVTRSCLHRLRAFLDARGPSEVETIARLTQTLCALYPSGSNERRGVEMLATQIAAWRRRRDAL